MLSSMIEGVLRHDTEMEVDRNYVDSHGQSEVAFAFCRLLGFQLLPRLKAIAAQRLYLLQFDTKTGQSISLVIMKYFITGSLNPLSFQEPLNCFDQQFVLRGASSFSF